MNLRRMRATFPFSFLVFFVLVSSCHAQSNTVELIVVANKISYSLGATIRLSGNFTLASSPIADGLVAIQVSDRLGNLELIRVLDTGTAPEPWKVRLTEFAACDSQGNPATSFSRGSLANFKVSLESLDAVLPRQVTLALNLFDAVGISIGILSSTFTLYPGEKYNVTTSMSIPSDAFVGSSMCCASVLTEDRFPYCAEKSVVFTITGTQTGSVSSALSAEGSGGSYGLSFKLPNTALLGDHQIYAGGRYGPVGVSANTIIDYYWLYTDVSRDSTINILDISIVAKAFGSRAGDVTFRPKADMNSDNVINIIDISRVAKDLGRTMM